MLNTDSRQYRFAYEIHSRSEIPSDFSALPKEDDWLVALFMPGDTDTFWQPPEYPPRIFLLKSDRLLIYPHPASDEELFETPLNSLMAVELQKSLLYGAIVFHATNASKEFRYSTVHQKLLNLFLCRMRLQWLPFVGLDLPVITLQSDLQRSLGQCMNELKTELDPGETLHEQYSQPAMQMKDRSWFFRRSRTAPALMIVVTNRRIIAISAGDGKRNDPYEMVIRYASARGLSAVNAVRENHDSVLLRLQLKNSSFWKYTLSAIQASAISRFSTVAWHLISAARGNLSIVLIPVALASSSMQQTDDSL